MFLAILLLYVEAPMNQFEAGRCRPNPCFLKFQLQVGKLDEYASENKEEFTMRKFHFHVFSVIKKRKTNLKFQP